MTRVVIFVLIMVIIPRALLAANQYTESQTLTKEPSPPLAAIELPDLGSEAAKKIEKEDFKEQSESYITNSAAQGFENLTPEALESQAKSYLQNKITSTAQSYIEGLMSPYGVVRTNLSVDQEGSLEGSSLNYFVPLYEDPDNVLF